MILTKRFSPLLLLLVALCVLVCNSPSQAQTKNRSAPPKYPNYPSETPDTVKPATATFDYERREVMIPMRDGVKLHHGYSGAAQRHQDEACADPADAHAL